MSTVATKAGRPVARQFEHCGHLMMLVKLPALAEGGSMQSQTGWRCNVCDTVVNLSTVGGGNGWLTKEIAPRQIDWLSIRLQLRRYQVARSTA
jgi:hypothetical protein